MKLKILSLLLLSTLFFAEANDRGVRISPNMKNEQRVALIIGNNNYQETLGGQGWGLQIYLLILVLLGSLAK